MLINPESHITFLLCLYFMLYSVHLSCIVGSCHHGMARPQVVDRGTASDMEGSCE